MMANANNEMRSRQAGRGALFPARFFAQEVELLNCTLNAETPNA